MGRKKGYSTIFISLLFHILWLVIGWGGPNLNAAIQSKRLLSFHFDKIEARGALTIFVEPGKRNRQVEYFADSEIIESIIAKVENRTLYLDANNSLELSRRIPLLRLSAQRVFPIEVIVSIDKLEEFRLLENSTVSLKNLSGNELKLYHNSTGSLHLIESRFKNITVRQEGSGDIILKGRETLDLDAKIFGNGSLLGEEFFLDNASIQHYGSGSILLAPNKWLDAQISSTGNLHLLAPPLGKVIRNEGKGGKIIEEY